MFAVDGAAPVIGRAGVESLEPFGRVGKARDDDETQVRRKGAGSAQQRKIVTRFAADKDNVRILQFAYRDAILLPPDLVPISGQQSGQLIRGMRIETGEHDLRHQHPPLRRFIRDYMARAVSQFGFYNRGMRSGLLLLVLTLPSLAQMDMAGHSMGVENQIPPEQLPAPKKMSGVGNQHMKVTANRKAQMWFDQGLNLIYDYWDYESARAFEQSIREDPQCAMCYWGLYQAESFYHGLSQGYAAPAMQKAAALESHASARERLLIDVTVAAEGARTPADRAKAAELSKTLQHDYPDDVQVKLWASGGGDRVAMLEGILRKDPNNSAANHYYIHALEASDHPEKALASAERLGKLAPASGHMVHMPGHIFFRVGDYASAEKAFAASTQVDERYMREQKVSVDNDWNYVHNLMYAVANLMEEGKLSEASTLSLKLSGARGERDSTLYTYSARDSISRLSPQLPVALRSGDWSRVLGLLNANPPGAQFPDLRYLAGQIGAFAAGMKAIEDHDVAKAVESDAAFDAAVRPSLAQSAAPRAAQPAQLTIRLMADADLQPLLTTLNVMSLELKASILAAQGRKTDAHEEFAKAALAEKNLGYHEPPNYIRPVGESEAAAMLSMSDWTDARAAYEAALKERPRSGFPLYGIALTSEKSGDLEAAKKEYADFLAAWKDADSGLPQIVHAREFIAVQGRRL